jgi:hypothetical protein
VFWRDTLPSTTLGQATQEEAAQNINFWFSPGWQAQVHESLPGAEGVLHKMDACTLHAFQKETRHQNGRTIVRSDATFL